MGFKVGNRQAPAVPTTRQHILAYALSLPDAFEDHPWGESVAKVGKKVFVFLGRAEDQDFGMSVKLPVSGPGILEMPFATPTGYGLGKAGWVSLQASAEQPIPVELLEELVLESYRALAPKRTLAKL